MTGFKAVDCSDYIENYLSAHADAELTPEETCAIEEHVRGCERCRAALAEERALKALIRNRLGERKAPAAVAARIRTALDGAQLDPRSTDAQPPRPRLAIDSQTCRRRSWIWMPVALAAAIVIAIVMDRGNFARRASIPLFDQAAVKLATFQTGFTPNVPSSGELALRQAYQAAQMPSGIWHFANFKLAGGRIDTAPDGRRVTYTVYRGPSDEMILCMRFKGAIEMAIPKDALMRMAGHSFYRYRGISLCVTIGPNQRFTCILASRMPIVRFERIVAAADVGQHS